MVTTCSFEVGYQYFGETCFKIEGVADPSEILVTTYKTTGCHEVHFYPLNSACVTMHVPVWIILFPLSDAYHLFSTENKMPRF
jgi:hypothetical protein